MDKKEYIIHFIYWLIKGMIFSTVLYLLYQFALFIIIGALVAYLLHPFAVKIIEYFGIHHHMIKSMILILMVFFAYLLAVLFMGIFIIVFVKIMSYLPLMMDSLYHQIMIQDYWVSLFTVIYRYTHQFFEELLSGLAGFLMNMIFNITSVFIKLFFSFIFSILFMLDYEYIKVLILKLPVNIRLSRYIQTGRVVIYQMMRTYLIMFVLCFIILICGLPLIVKKNVLMIAFFICQFDFFPVLGIDMIMIPWIIVLLLLHDLKRAVVLGIIYFVIVVMKNVVEPRLLGKITGIKPIWVFILMFVLMNVNGMKGLLIMPVIMIIVYILKVEHMQSFD